MKEKQYLEKYDRIRELLKNDFLQSYIQSYDSKDYMHEIIALKELLEIAKEMEHIVVDNTVPYKKDIPNNRIDVRLLSNKTTLRLLLDFGQNIDEDGLTKLSRNALLWWLENNYKVEYGLIDCLLF